MNDTEFNLKDTSNMIFKEREMLLQHPQVVKRRFVEAYSEITLSYNITLGLYSASKKKSNSAG